jgi:K+:H+ antiporter
VSVHDAPQFLTALTIVLCVAAITTVVFQRLHQPVVLGYILAGVLVGPYVPFPLVADPTVVQTLSQLGIILLMFSLGLEFSLRRLAQVGPVAGLTAVIETSFMLWLGVQVGRLVGWSGLGSLLAGAVVAISSTTIIAKAFEEQRVTGRLRELVVGVLVVEDLIAILLVAALTVAASGSGLSAGPVALMAGRLGAFLAGLVLLGLLLVPRTVRAITRLGRRETTLVACIGLCFAMALLARSAGYTVALGAFLAGSLIAESGEREQIVPLIEPVRDMFAAIFFVSVGMLIDPGVIARHWVATAALTATVVVGKVSGVSLGAFLSGNGLRTSIQAGMSMAQIGEFSFIIAGLGLTMRGGASLYPVAVAVSAVTTLLTPWLIRFAGPFAAWVDQRLPKPLQTFAALYGGWIEQLRATPPARTAMSRVRHLLRLLVLDAGVIAAILVGTAASLDFLVSRGQVVFGLRASLVRAIAVIAAAALSLPFWLGVVRVGRRLGVALARVALPQRVGGRVDLARAPRRVLVVTLQLASILLVGAPLLALTQPFLPGIPVALVLAVSLAVLSVAFWRNATDLQGHIRAGAQVIVDAIAAQSAGGVRGQDPVERARTLMPGIGPLVAVRLEAGSPAVGRTLAELNLRGLTGATVLAITRDGAAGPVIVPSAMERLHHGDTLALAGTAEAIEAATRLLQPSPGAL